MSALIPALRVVLPDASGYIHAHAFDEVSLALVAALRRIGLSVETTRECRQGRGRVLVLAPHLQTLADLDRLGRDAILYTWEPMGWSHTVFMRPELTTLMRDFVIWDYSHNNVKTWRSLGSRHIFHVPFTYDPALEQLPRPEQEPVVDVLFYGSLTERRKVVIEDLIGRGLKVKCLFGVYGQDRNAWIGRSRLVLNMHAHDGQILELPRLAYLWANRVPTVSEVNTHTEDSLGMASVMLSAPYERLADKVAEVLRDPAAAAESARLSYERFRDGPHMQQTLRYAFAASKNEHSDHVCLSGRQDRTHQ